MHKKLLFSMLAFLFAGILTVQGQNVFFTTNYTEYAPWDEEAQDFIDFVGQEQVTTFELFEDLSKFIHTTETMESTYIVDEQRYDEQTETYEFEVTSDAGNHYIFIIDLNEQKLKAVGNGEDGAFVVVYHIDNSWTAEE